MVLREARRFLRSSPLLSLSGIVVLGLGFGASALALSLLLAFSSLVYPGMRNLGYATIAEETEGGGSAPIAWKKFEELRSVSAGAARIAAYGRPVGATLQDGDRTTTLSVTAVSGGFFSVFTLPLSAGRDFKLSEESKGGTHVTIISFSLAISLFESPQAALGRFVDLDGTPFLVVGVGPPGFEGIFGTPTAAWVPANCVIPLVLNPAPGLVRPNAWESLDDFYSVAASNRISSPRLVQELAQSILQRAPTEGTLHVSQGLTTDPVRDAKLRKWLRLGLLLALVFTVVSGLNYALLLLARTPRYAEEVRLKRALGAESAHLAKEIIIGPATSVGLGLLAAALIWAVSLALISHMSAFYEQLLRGSWRAALLALSLQVPLACALVLVIALFPILTLVRDDGPPRVGYVCTTGRRTGLLLQVLVTLQITLCIGTWILSGMIVSAVRSLTSEPLGFLPNHLAVVYIGPTSGAVSFVVGPDRSFPTSAAIEGLLAKVSALPGVRSVSFAGSAPFDQPMGTLKLQLLDSAVDAPRTVNETAVSPGYFRTIGNKIIRGRGFDQDLSGTTNEIVINETLARELWPNGDPLNRPVKLIYPTFAGMPSFSSVATVVGVTENMRFSGFSESPEPTIFKTLKGTSFVTSYLIVNGTESVHSLWNAASRQVASQMPGLGVLRAYSVADRARASLWRERDRAFFALAGALAMALVAYIGLYGSLVHYVNARRRELAVRICLGALPWTIRKIVIARTVWCALIATALAAPLWPVLYRLSSSNYMGRVSWSTSLAALLSLACVSVAVLISLIPAAAAARVSPAAELKEQ
jgi:predicted permease